MEIRMRRIITTAAALLLAACATNATVPAPAPAGTYAPTQIPYAAGTSRAAADQPAGAYALDPRHASVLWKVRHAGLAIFVARFDTMSGTLNFDSKNPAASTLSVTIAAASVSTGVLNNAGERAFDREIATQAFGAEANPEIKFVSRSVAVTGPTTGTITGDLTLKGVTKPMTLEVSFEGGRFVQFRGKQILGFAARGTFNRKDFGASLSNPLADGFASDIVELEINAEFIQQ
jgi:polyisoprenoid-binding protein YceI